MEPSTSDVPSRSSPVDPQVLQRCLAVTRRTPAGLLTDIDGTISQIAAVPGDARVDPMARAALERLDRSLALVGVVTGRAAAVAQGMVDLPDLLYIGNHGLERQHRGEVWTQPTAAAGSDCMARALREVAAEAQQRGVADGVVIEDKHLSGSIHFRLAPDPDAARSVLLPLTMEIAERYDLRVTSGLQVLELRPSVVVTKGTAIVDLVAQRRLHGVLFFGDDLTDVDGFKALQVLRASGAVDALLIGVVSPETHPDVLSHTDIVVAGVTGCALLLNALADALAPRLSIHPDTGTPGEDTP